jgi:hypothetical protein
MKARLITATLLAAALAAVQPVPAAAGGGGTTSANFLKIPTAPLPSAMSEAYTAMVGPDSLQYNPAGLGLLGYSSFSGAHNQYIDGITQEYVAASWRSRFGTLGASFTTLSSGKIEAYDSNDMRIGDTSSSHRMISLAYAQSWPHFDKDIGKLDPMLIRPSWTKVEPVLEYRPKTYRLSAGAAVKRVSEKLGADSSSSYAFDAGLLLVLPRHFQVGASAMNFGGKEKFVSESYDLPSSLRFGLAKDFQTVNNIMVFTVTADAVKYSDRDAFGASGLEVDIMKMFQVRLGYRTQKDSGSRISGGFGMNFDRLSDKNGFFKGARMDYAYVDYGGLGPTHRIGAQFIW